MSFDYFQIIQWAFQYGPSVKAAIDEAISNDDLTTKIRNIAGPLAPLLEQVGAQWFPKAAPALHVVGAVIATADPNATKWLQQALNQLATPSPNLVVDGVYGQATRAAVEQLQVQLGLTVDGLAGQLTQAAIQMALAKLSPAA